VPLALEPSVMLEGELVEEELGQFEEVH